MIYFNTFIGYATGEIIQQYWPAYVQDTFDPTQNDKLNAFLDANFRFMNKNIAQAKNSSDNALKTYWHHVSLLLQQVEGLHSGYLKLALEKKFSPLLSLTDFFKYQIGGDMDDLSSKWDPPSFNTMNKFEMESFAIFSTRCSAFIKYNKDRSDIFLTHATWAGYVNIMRIFKHYRINFKGVPAQLISFSSAPAWLASLDDFYITSAGLGKFILILIIENLL